MKGSGWLLLGMLWAGGARAQDAPAAPAVVVPKVLGALLLPDKPYSGVQEYVREQKTGEGKTLTFHETMKFWRDGAGRTRKEVTREHERVVWTYLTDPAAKVRYSWNNESKVAFVTRLGEPVPPRASTHPLQPDEVRDVTLTVGGKRMKGWVNLLPAKTIEGQPTIGTHQVAYSDDTRTTVFSTTDTFYQPDFHMTLEQAIVDQQYGHRMWHFRSFKPGEQKAELFMVPKGYALKAQETPETEQFD